MQGDNRWETDFAEIDWLFLMLPDNRYRALGKHKTRRAPERIRYTRDKTIPGMDGR
jgi:hypothetical protein